MVMLVKMALHLASVADQEPDPSGSELICRICVIRKLKEVKHITVVQESWPVFLAASLKKCLFNFQYMFTERLTKFLKKKHDFCAVLGLGIGSGSNVIKIYKQHTTLLRNPYSYVKTVQNVSWAKADITKI